MWDELYAFPQELARAYIADQLYAGNALLLLDGLDETVVGDTIERASASYTKVSEVIQKVARVYLNAYIVITVRQAGYRQHAPLVGFTPLFVNDFSMENIRQFITNWYICSQDPFKDTKIADLTMRLERNSRIQALATNPLLLSLIVLLYESRHDLPERRADLYDRCTKVLLSEWDA